MHSGRYVNRDTVIKRVEQYYGLDASGKDVDDFIYDGLRGIGTFNMYDFIATTGENNMPDPIKVTDYRGTLPNNIEFPIQVLDKETESPMTCNTSIFSNDYNLNVPGNATMAYELRRNHIFTNVKEQEIVLVYLGFPLDDSNHPLIPDEENYLKAITAYVAKSLAFPLYLKKQLNGNIYQSIEQDYYAYAHGAHEIETPNVDEMEMIKNQIVQFLPNYTAYMSNFRGVGALHKIKYV